MKLHEIININDNTDDVILIEKMIPYKKMLYAIYSRG